MLLKTGISRNSLGTDFPAAHRCHLGLGHLSWGLLCCERAPHSSCDSHPLDASGSVSVSVTPWIPWGPPGSSVHGISQPSCHFLLQEIFPTQGSNPCLLHCRQILYQGSLMPVVTSKISPFRQCQGSPGGQSCPGKRTTSVEFHPNSSASGTKPCTSPACSELTYLSARHAQMHTF